MTDTESMENAWHEVALAATALGIKPTRVVQSTQVPSASYGRRKSIDELTEEINELLPEGVTVEQYLAIPEAQYEVEYLVPGGEWQKTRSIVFPTPERGFAWIDDYVTDSDHMGDPCPKHRALGVNPGCPDCDQPGDDEERKCYRVVEVTRKMVRRLGEVKD